MFNNATLKRLILLSIVALLLAACGGENEPNTPTPGGGAEVTATQPVTDEPPLNGTSWQLAAMNGADIDLQEPVTIVFDGGHASGFSGCNDYGGAYTATTGGEFAMPEIEQTDMYCDSGTDIEDEYLSTLQEAARYEVVEESRLELLASDGELLLVFSTQ